jgi:hypothetical protein
VRVEAKKIQQRGSVTSPLGEELAERFLGAYVRAAGERLEDERQLRVRTALYEVVALLRLALRGQQNLDETRFEVTSALLEERMSVAGELEQR